LHTSVGMQRRMCGGEEMNDCTGCKHTEKHSGQEPCNSCGPTENFCYYQPIEKEPFEIKSAKADAELLVMK
jgi:hypothetical protein